MVKVSPPDNHELDNSGFAPSQIELLAASLRLNASDISNSIPALAQLLQSIAPNSCQIKQRKRGLMSKQKNIEEISVQLGDDIFSISQLGSGSAVKAIRSKIVRGITIKTDELSTDEWISSLAESLAVEAQKSETARSAISKLLGAT